MRLFYGWLNYYQNECNKLWGKKWPIFPWSAPPPSPRQVGWVVSSLVGMTIVPILTYIVHDEYRHETQASEITILEKFCFGIIKSLFGTYRGLATRLVTTDFVNCFWNVASSLGSFSQCLYCSLQRGADAPRIILYRGDATPWLWYIYETNPTYFTIYCMHRVQ